MKRAVNIIAFGNVFQLVHSFWAGWDVSKADDILKRHGIGLMLLPLRGLSRNVFKAEVLCYEESWNNSEFWPALIKFIGDLKFAFLGSPTTQEGASVLDRVSGMNFQGSGTIIDWLLFGTLKEGSVQYQWIKRSFPDALETAHHLNDESSVIEVHPEFRREVCQSLGISQKEFVGWLVSQRFPLCVDTFHTFLRGSRDGIDPHPVVQGARTDFLWKVNHRIHEVHLRLSKKETKLILEGRAKELPLFEEMAWMYHNCRQAIMVLEIYPDLFATQEATAKKVVKIWECLEDSFNY